MLRLHTTAFLSVLTYASDDPICLITIEGKVVVGGNGTLLCTAPNARPSGLQQARALLLMCSARVGCAQIRIRTFLVIGSIWSCALVHLPLWASAAWVGWNEME
jgi:hypothetical protein